MQWLFRQGMLMAAETVRHCPAPRRLDCCRWLCFAIWIEAEHRSRQAIQPANQRANEPTNTPALPCFPLEQRQQQ